MIKKEKFQMIWKARGDIDVAIISKSDGFIWKKKKDYFKHDLNPQINEKT